MPGKCRFNHAWLQMEKYMSWVKTGEDPGRAKCRLCCGKTFDISNMGEAAFQQYSTCASGVGKGYSHGWCSAVATRLEAEWRRQQHPWEYPLPTPLALV